MPFYLRRTFRLGLLRLNLPRRGGGISAGVKGARLGVDAGGRGGIYVLERLGRGRRVSRGARWLLVAIAGGVGLAWLFWP